MCAEHFNAHGSKYPSCPPNTLSLLHATGSTLYFCS